MLVYQRVCRLSTWPPRSVCHVSSKMVFFFVHQNAKGPQAKQWDDWFQKQANWKHSEVTATQNENSQVTSPEKIVINHINHLSLYLFGDQKHQVPPWHVISLQVQNSRLVTMLPVMDGWDPLDHVQISGHEIFVGILWLIMVDNG